jgi:hypothetical protein
MKLILAGLVIFVIGVLAFFTFAMHAVLYVPICQPGEHWIHEGGCRILELRIGAAMGVTALGIVLVLWGGVVRWRDHSVRHLGFPGPVDVSPVPLRARPRSS